MLDMNANVVMKQYQHVFLIIAAFQRMNTVKKTKALATVKLDKKSHLKIFVKTKANALYHSLDLLLLKAIAHLTMIALQVTFLLGFVLIELIVHWNHIVKEHLDKLLENYVLLQIRAFSINNVMASK